MEERRGGMKGGERERVERRWREGTGSGTHFYSLQGAKVIAELSELVNELPEVYDVILRDLPHLLTPISFYQTFLHTVNERQVVS